jgi:hypothetical protein
LKLLMTASNLWTSDLDITSDACEAIVKHIRRATLEEQKGLVFLTQHVLHCSTKFKGYFPWYNRIGGDDSGFWTDHGVDFQPVVWMFRFDPTELLKSDRFEIEFERDRNHKQDVIAMLLDAEKQWRSVNGQEKYWQKNGLDDFVVDLKSWAKTVDRLDQPVVVRSLLTHLAAVADIC